MKKRIEKAKANFVLNIIKSDIQRPKEKSQLRDNSRHSRLT
jgi:hypothetical protein